MPQLYTEIFIRRSPAECREIFLDFPSWSTWHTGFMKSIKPTPPTPSTTLKSSDLQGSSPLFVPGAKLTVDLAGFGVIHPVLVLNSELEFKWRGGSKWAGFVGEHGFRWEEGIDENGDRGTRMVHEEHFWGYMSWLMGPNWLAGVLGLREKSRKDFIGWCEEFKRRCEDGGGKKVV